LRFGSLLSSWLATWPGESGKVLVANLNLEERGGKRAMTGEMAGKSEKAKGDRPKVVSPRSKG
jgi:hypothetical protein